ncbi:MAG: GTPase HflX [Cellvibrionaceae bacterium]|nr:GTPase HflX [Cellvibrionaceae bacterium]
MFFERPKSGELALLVHIDFPPSDTGKASGGNDPREFEELVLSAGGDPVDFVVGRRYGPDAKFFVGSGKVQELAAKVKAHDAKLVVFNHSLSPSQERNLERALACRVLDRTGLILDIFAQRARTHEGKLQVELAQLRHIATRLIRGWTHLERQKGGIGLRGPGETQLETDRRLLRARIKSIEARLERVRKQRQQGRRSRARASVPTLSFVGYTNAGKSTLFNRLTGADVYAQDQLFATLDPTMRRLNVPGVGALILADTVGFISNLPHRLVQAFRATLEEAAHASLLLHVIDAGDSNRQRNIEQVQQVLTDIGADALPQLKVYNKLDLLEDRKPRLERDQQGRPLAVWLSAATGEGLDLLLTALTELFAQTQIAGRLRLTSGLAALRAKFYELGVIESEDYCDDGSSEADIVIPKIELHKLLSVHSLSLQHLEWIGTAPIVDER